MATHLKIFFTNQKSLAIGSAFFLLGFLFGNWATMIPFVKSFYQIDDATLGLMLLCLPLGAMTFNPIAALLIQKYGMQRVAAVGMFLLCFAYMLPLSISHLYFVPLGLIVIGFCMTILNISANITANSFEQTEQVNIMSTCHGMFSVGLMIGSLMRSITLLIGLDERFHMFSMCFLGILLSIYFYKTIFHLETIQKQEIDKPKKLTMIIPKGELLGIILISICINVTEGSMTDWASLFMKEVVKTTPFFVGWGLFGYSALMATGRFLGDAIIPTYGKKDVLMGGAILTILGLLMIIFLPFTTTAIIGFAIIGLGVSCGAPILYASAARYPGLPDGGGLAIMNTFAMAGFLLGPVVIGFISNQTSLSLAFGCVAVLCLLWLSKSRTTVFY